MIDSQREISSSAILTAERIPSENVFFVQHDFLEGYPYKYIQADNARKGKTAGNRTDRFLRVVRDRHGFTAEEQQNGFLGVAYT